LSQRGKDRMEREYPEDPSMVGEIAAGFHPVVRHYESQWRPNRFVKE
jgi:hypothetical protein